MTISSEAVSRFASEGYLLLEQRLTGEEVQSLIREFASLGDDVSDSRVMEKDGKTLRALHGSHLRSPMCASLTRLPRVVGPVLQILDSRVYVYQFKFHQKAALTGDMWQWHQDFIYWHHEDGMAEPRAINVAVFLDDVHEFNGPIMLLPGSHTAGLIDPRSPGGGKSDDWRHHVSATLKYTVEPASLRALVERHGIVAPKGPAGSILVFHPNVIHASAPNMSPFDRRTIFITYNDVANVPQRPLERPEFLVSRDSTAVVPLANDTLLVN